MSPSKTKATLLPGLLALLMGVIGIAVVITTIQTVNTEPRSPAQDSTKPTTTIKTDPQNPLPYQTLNIEFQINTKNRQISAIEMKNIPQSATVADLILDLAKVPHEHHSGGEN